MESPFKTYSLHFLLFIATFITTTVAGIEWTSGMPIQWNADLLLDYAKIEQGLHYSISFLTILTLHEFGHYFMARKYKKDVSLPYYLPQWLFGLPIIGTFGAVIRIKTRDITSKQHFDIGIAGPLAGFIAALALLSYGFTHLPDKYEYIYSIHPEYRKLGKAFVDNMPSMPGGIVFGKNLLFCFFESFIANPDLVPPKYEMMHYPYLLAGYLSLFFTALNLLPIGQLDGGHVLYGLVGEKWHAFVSKFVLILLACYAGLGILHPYMPIDEFIVTLLIYLFALYNVLHHVVPRPLNRLTLAVTIATAQFLLVYFFPTLEGYPGWIVFALIVGRFLGIQHPSSETVKLGLGRKILGWFALLIFVLCFSPQPMSF